jgi:hypothetical protein
MFTVFQSFPDLMKTSAILNKRSEYTCKLSSGKDTGGQFLASFIAITWCFRNKLQTPKRENTTDSKYDQVFVANYLRVCQDCSQNKKLSKYMQPTEEKDSTKEARKNC